MLRSTSIFLLLIGFGLHCCMTDPEPSPNVLFIAVDDLCPALGCYGMGQAITPNIDRLASEGRLFTNHYVQVPTCGASRCCLLTGQLPYMKSQLRNNALDLLPRTKTNEALTMPELFKRNGYRTVCIGKISHSSDGWRGYGDSLVSENHHVPNAWDEVITPRGQWKGSLVVAYPDGRDRDEDSGEMAYCEFKEMEDNAMPDGMFAETAIDRLKAFQKTGEPFFMGVGFVKPHLPFVAPQKYKDLYNGVKIPSPYGMKRGDTQKASHSAEFYKYTTNRPFDEPKPGESLSEKDAQEVRRAYMACVSYTDAQIGKLLKALEKSELDKNTVVVLWGDHGWHLGENNVWGKHTPLEKALRSPLIIRIPKQPHGGVHTGSLAAAVDLYPTLIELCHLKNRNTDQPLDGVSLVPVLNNPGVIVRSEAISFWGNATSLTDGTYRLIVSPDSGENQKRVYELYDHQSDPGELHNVAFENPLVVDLLMNQIKEVYPQIFVENDQ